MRANNKDFKNLSRQLIVEALLELMKEKPYQDISVTEITKKADVARRTFYFNYSDKDDVLEEFLEMFGKRLFKRINEKTNERMSSKNFIRIYFEFWKEEIEFATILIKNNLFIRLFMLIEDDKIAFDNKLKEEVKNILTKEEENYFLIFHATGLWSLLELWVKNGAKETPEEMAKIYEKIIGVNLK